MSRNLRNGHDRSHQSSKISVSRLVFVILHDHGDLKRSFHLIEQEITEIYDCAVSERNPHFQGFSKKFSGEPWRTFSVILELVYICSQKGIYYQYRSPALRKLMLL